MARDYEATVRKLYAKANAAGVTPEEKAECERQAKIYMARYGVKHVLEDAKVGSDNLIHTEYAFAAPYADQKAALYNSMALSFGCRVVKSKRNGGTIYTLVGFKADYERLEFMFKMILNQAFRDVSYVDIPEWESVRSFRVSWWSGFTYEVVARLDESKAAAEREVAATGYALAIRDRSQLVNDKVNELFPVLRKGAARKVRSYSGYTAGKVSGRNAEFHDKDAIVNQRAINEGV